MEINFKNIKFAVENQKLILKQLDEMIFDGECGISEVQVCGENKNSHLGIKMPRSSEGERLLYVSHAQTDDSLILTQESSLIRVSTEFTSYNDCNALRIKTTVENISDEDIVLEEVSAFTLWGFGENKLESAKEFFLTKFYQGHHTECRPKRISFSDGGLIIGCSEGQNRLFGVNIGSWSTKEELPQGIIEDAGRKRALMFQIESNSSWYYEIGDRAGKFYLYLGGANLPFGGWCKKLKPRETYTTPNVVLSFGNSVNEAIKQMTIYRREIVGKSAADKNLPVIFNEYMHLSWDSPTEENTKALVPTIAKTGAEYYVIDCGWHNEEDGDKVYPYVGQWKESRKRFPHGVRAITDYIRSYGMKAGLWIEPEIIGINCSEMLDYYDDNCFMQRNGKRIAVMGRYFLDYRNKKVRDYMTETIRRMVEDYGADYIKFDYNQDVGSGTDLLAFCAGEGLELCQNAFFNWVEEITAKYPNVLFESCASGGMRMDYKTLSAFSIASTSDQTDYLKYPYIVGNMLAAILPEQAAVWSYPVGIGTVGKPIEKTQKQIWEEITTERITMNMINSFLGRMHLASHLELLNKKQLSLVQDGIAYYKKLSEIKKQVLPYFPNGFTEFGDDNVVAGFENGDKGYLAIWHIKGSREVKVNESFVSLKICYPVESNVTFDILENETIFRFSVEGQAIFVEVQKNKLISQKDLKNNGGIECGEKAVC